MSKLAPAIKYHSVCLRCQYRLFHSGRAVRQSSQLQTQTEDFIPGYKEAFIPRVEERQQQQDNDLFQRLLDKDSEGGLPAGDRKGISQNTFKRLDIYKKSPLGFDALGQPASVLILDNKKERERQKRRSLKSQVEDETAKKGLSSSELLEKVNKERGIIGDPQFIRNLEVFRDSILGVGQDDKEKTGLVDDKIFEQLVRGINKGFTVKQMQTYIQRQMGDNKSGSLSKSFASEIYARSAWRLGITSLEQVRAPAVHPSNKSAQQELDAKPVIVQSSRKDDLVDAILRQCWGLRPRKELMEIGELDIRIRPVQLDIILKHRSGILKKLSEDYESKIEVIRGEEAIRITADWTTCEDLLGVFVGILNRVCYAEVKTDPNISKKIERPGLAHIESASCTIIKAHWKFGNAERVYYVNYLGPETTDLDDARRLIIIASKASKPPVQKLIWGFTPSSSSISSSPFIVGDTAHFKDSAERWSRWCTPATKTMSPTSAVHKAESRFDLDKVDRRDAALKETNKFLTHDKISNNTYEMPTSISEYWQPRLSATPTAILGQLVFHKDLASEVESTHLQNSTKKTRKKDFEGRVSLMKREFVTAFPGMVRSLEGRGEAEENTESLIITMSPHFPPNALPAYAQTFPDLEIKIDLDNFLETTTIGHARLIINQRQLDLLLPNNTVDIRFSQTAHLSNGSKHDPAISAFIAASDLNIWGDGRLRTPTSLNLSIPAHAFQQIDPNDKLQLFPISPETLQEPLQYNFSSLEHHSNLHVPFKNDTILTYTIIEAGRTGGRREQLSLNPSSNPRRKQIPNSKVSAQYDQYMAARGTDPRNQPTRAQEEEEERTETLTKTALELITDIEKQEGERDQATVEERGRSEESLEKLAREATQAWSISDSDEERPMSKEEEKMAKEAASKEREKILRKRVRRKEVARAEASNKLSGRGSVSTRDEEVEKQGFAKREMRRPEEERGEEARLKRRRELKKKELERRKIKALDTRDKKPEDLFAEWETRWDVAKQKREQKKKDLKALRVELKSKRMYAVRKGLMTMGRREVRVGRIGRLEEGGVVRNVFPESMVVDEERGGD